MRYSLSPERKARRVISTSLKSMGSQPSLLSRVMVAWAMPARARCWLPAKIMSAVRRARNVL